MQWYTSVLTFCGHILRHELSLVVDSNFEFSLAHHSYANLRRRAKKHLILIAPLCGLPRNAIQFSLGCPTCSIAGASWRLFTNRPQVQAQGLQQPTYLVSEHMKLDQVAHSIISTIHCSLPLSSCNDSFRRRDLLYLDLSVSGRFFCGMVSICPDMWGAILCCRPRLCVETEDILNDGRTVTRFERIVKDALIKRVGMLQSLIPSFGRATATFFSPSHYYNTRTRRSSQRSIILQPPSTVPDKMQFSLVALFAIAATVVSAGPLRLRQSTCDIKSEPLILSLVGPHLSGPQPASSISRPQVYIHNLDFSFHSCSRDDSRCLRICRRPRGTRCVLRASRSPSPSRLTIALDPIADAGCLVAATKIIVELVSVLP
jgi:hypothetical protein